MKYIVKIILMLTLIYSLSYSQECWEWQNPLPQGNNLYDVHIFEDNSAITVGNTGTIIDINSNAQIELFRQNVNGKYTRFNCVHFVNNDIGWIGGDGYILKTIDGGESWKETKIDSVDSTETFRYDHIFFINDQIGWITGWCGGGWVTPIGIVLKTIDGGETWIKISGCEIGDLHFINPDTGWAIFEFYDWEMGGSSSLFKTVDGGLNWEEQSGIEEIVNTLFFISDSLGWVGTYGSICRTQDGRTWETILDSVSCEKIYFQDSNHGWALLYNESIIYTDDGGDTWEEQTYSSQNIFRLYLNSFKINGNKYGIAVGEGGHIRVKKSESEVWEPITSTCFNGEIISIQIVDENTIWACGWDYQFGYYTPPYGPYGYKALVHSNDGGSTWQIIGFDDKDLSKYNDIFFLNDQLGWVVGQNDFIMHTDNGGENWQYQNSGYENNGDLSLKKVMFVDSLYGWILGSGILFNTKDGGKTWNYKQNIMPSSFVGYDIQFVNKNEGWLVGHNGYDGAGETYHTQDGGQTWQLNKRKTDHWCYKKVQFLDSLSGWVSGDHFQSELLHTENGGDSWEIIFESPFQITDFLFQDKNHGWIMLSNVYGCHYSPYPHPTLLFRTSDGGQNWEEFSIPCPNINAIGFANLNVGWAVGYNGSILKTTTGGGITSIKDRSSDLVRNPDNFRLYQNYPNPFNPATKIEFTLPISEYVELKVFNILGTEVSTLVSRKLHQGNHTYTFDGRNLASGVYYYQLFAGDFREVKKMILLR